MWADAIYSISIEGRDAPTRTVTFLDQSIVGNSLALRFTTYRTIATLEVAKGSPESEATPLQRGPKDHSKPV